MEKLILRKAKLEDLDSMWNNIWQDKELAKYMLWKPVENIEEAKIRLEKTIEYQKSNLAFYICLEESDEAIGFLGAANIGNGVFEDCGICIANKYQGKGFGKQAMQLLLKMIFEELGEKEFIYSCFEENKKSQRLCESLGFEYKYTKQNTRKWDGLNYTAKYYLKKSRTDPRQQFTLKQKTCWVFYDTKRILAGIGGDAKRVRSTGREGKPRKAR
ncbi:MAG: GNAT family N-acetyltransferase [Treponema sp.]|nr:GNAT family N-acetyltransferase [Treponema sp.]